MRKESEDLLVSDSYDFQSLVSTNFEKGIKWVADHLYLFKPQDMTDTKQMKPLTELALMYLLIKRWAPQLQSYTEDIERIETFLLKELCNPIPVYTVLKAPWYYNHYLGFYIIMRAAGHHNNLYDEAIYRLSRYGYPNAIEGSFYRKLETQYYHAIAGIKPFKKPNWNSSLYVNTTLGQCRNPIFLSRLEAYSITHTIFYTTDFSENTDSLSGEEKEKITKILDVLLFHYWRKRDWDLTAEILWNLLAFPSYKSSWFFSATEELLKNWHEDGSLPGPRFKKQKTTDQVESIEKLFPDLYHTTLVGVLFCGAYLYHKERRTIA